MEFLSIFFEDFKEETNSILDDALNGRFHCLVSDEAIGDNVKNDAQLMFLKEIIRCVYVCCVKYPSVFHDAFHHDACQLCCQAQQQPLEVVAGLDNVVQSGPQPEDHFAKASIMMLSIMMLANFQRCAKWSSA